MSGDERRKRPRGATGADGRDGCAGPFSLLSVWPPVFPVNVVCFFCGTSEVAHLCGADCHHPWAFLALYGALAFCGSCSGIIGARPLAEVAP